MGGPAGRLETLDRDVLEVMQETIRRHAMLAGGETVLVAVSGGADSTALLHLLAALAPQWRLRLHVLHVDHQLRDDSSRDAAAVVALSRRLGIPAEVATVDVERRGSPEEAARRARYAALDAWADRLGAGRIAVGHTADDQAETVLMRVLQGARLRGLAGIPARRGRIIRPLLALRRRAIVGELERAGLPWIEDPSNRDPKFLRNRVRNDLLPTLAAAHHGDLVAALNAVGARAREAVDALDRLAVAELHRLATPGRDALTLARAPLLALAPMVAAEVLRQAARRLGSHAPLRAWAHHGLRRLLGSPPPRPFRLGGLRIEASGDQVLVARHAPPPLVTRALPVPGRLELPEIDRVVACRLLPAGRYTISRHANVAAFDADHLRRSLVVRGRRRGDRFHPFGLPADRRLKTFLIDAKVPRWERARLPLIEAGGEIVWVAGLRRGAHAPVTSRTRCVLELRLEPLAN